MFRCTFLGRKITRTADTNAPLARAALAFFFIAAGTNHFITPEPYLAIVPPILPWPAALVFISGAAEIAGGAGLLWRPSRKIAALGLIALLVVLFPANVYAAMHGMNIAGWSVPAWILWGRLPLQALLIWWVYIACWKARELPR